MRNCGETIEQRKSKLYKGEKTLLGNHIHWHLEDTKKIFYESDSLNTNSLCHLNFLMTDLVIFQVLPKTNVNVNKKRKENF